MLKHKLNAYREQERAREQREWEYALRTLDYCVSGVARCTPLAGKDAFWAKRLAAYQTQLDALCKKYPKLKKMIED